MDTIYTIAFLYVEPFITISSGALAVFNPELFATIQIPNAKESIQTDENMLAMISFFGLMIIVYGLTMLVIFSSRSIDVMRKGVIALMVGDFLHLYCVYLRGEKMFGSYFVPVALGNWLSTLTLLIIRLIFYFTTSSPSAMKVK
jgi:hypothetical protein